MQIKTILSVTYEGEREQIGLSYVPYTEEEYKKAGIDTLHTFDIPDHTLLSVEEMQRANDEIHQALQQGNVYVHCQGGKGRSAQAIAAYLMGTHQKSPQDAADLIQEQRPMSTIQKKMPALNAFWRFLHP